MPTDETLICQTRDLQKFDKPVAPVFIFGSTLGALALTDTRLLFLSSGGAGLGRALVSEMLGVFTPTVLREVDLALSRPGSLAVPHERLIDCSAQRRWDFGRYLRVTYERDGQEQHAAFIPRGVASSGWIEPFVDEVNAIVSRHLG